MLRLFPREVRQKLLLQALQQGFVVFLTGARPLVVPDALRLGLHRQHPLFKYFLGELLKLSSVITEYQVQLLVVDRRGDLVPVGAKRWIKTARPCAITGPNARKWQSGMICISQFESQMAY